MSVDYGLDFGIGYEVEINHDKLSDFVTFDDDEEEIDVDELRNVDIHYAFEEFLEAKLKDTDFKLIYWGDTYDDEYIHAIVLKKELCDIDLNLEPYKAKLDKWLSEQEVCKPVGEFGLVGGLYIS